VYAIVRTGGCQYKVEKNSIIEVNKLDADEGAEFVIDDVLMLCDETGVKVGSPRVPGAKVKAKVLKQFKGEKIDAYTYKPKKRQQRHWGHRQLLTRLQITDIEVR